MQIEIVSTNCPKCKSNNKQIMAFVHDDFRYQCKDCGCNFNIHYDRLPTQVRVWEEKIVEPNTEELFAREYECEWIKNSERDTR